MERRAAFLLAVVLVVLLPLPAVAQPQLGDCTIGPGVAATLLIPYFEVNTVNPLRQTTLFSVNNGFAEPTLARVVLWTDWGVPTLAFDVYLEGFDVQTINLRDVFNGNIPSTGEGADLSGFPFCGGPLSPIHANPVLTTLERQQLAADHTGVIGPMGGLCAGENHGDEIARGYITADVVDECSGVESGNPIFTPDNTLYPYFADGGGPGGIAITDNVLWGDVLYVNTDGGFAQASEAVAIWADPGLFSGTDINTFYGRYSGWDGRDDRVPLAWLWDQRFLNGGPFAGGANLIVWRDTGSPAASRVSCAGGPPWRPLLGLLSSLDENAANLFTSAATEIDLATQRVDVSAFGIPYSFGWIQIDTFPRQTWVEATLTAAGLYSATFNGTPVQSVCGLSPP